MPETSSILFDISAGTPKDRGFLENLGHPVLVCHGPAESPCPLLTEGGCQLVDQAHGIVFQFDLDRPEHRTILARYKEVVREDVPIVVVIPPEQATRYPDLVRGLSVLTHEPDVADLDGLAAEVEAADWSSSLEI